MCDTLQVESWRVTAVSLLEFWLRLGGPSKAQSQPLVSHGCSVYRRKCSALSHSTAAPGLPNKIHQPSVTRCHAALSWKRCIRFSLGSARPPASLRRYCVSRARLRLSSFSPSLPRSTSPLSCRINQLYFKQALMKNRGEGKSGWRPQRWRKDRCAHNRTRRNRDFASCDADHSTVSLHPVHVAREEKVAEGDGGRLARTWFMLS